MKYNIFNVLILTLFCWSTVYAADTSTRIFDKTVKTLSVRNLDNFNYPPIIRLNTSDQLSINFDIIGEEHQYLRYKVMHCNSDWQPSRLIESEYVEGFNEGEISDFAYSENTYVHYVNYNINIPNEDLKILQSGNYLLIIYKEYEPETPLLQVRFSVSENIASIAPALTSRTDKGFNTEYQQLSLAVECSSLPAINPYQDLIVVVTQNNRPETMRQVSHPMRVDGKKVIFEHDPALIFEASNEYRRFETVRTDYPGMHVDSVKFGGTNWHAYLKKDFPREDKDYLFDQTQKGRFKIDDYYSTDSDLGADYVTVHFTLDAPEVINGDIYVDGDFTNHQFGEFNKMIYDRNSGEYEVQIPLKQGSYNYQYVVRGRDGGYPEVSIIEGNKYETHNEYLINVFYRGPGSRGDRLIGSSQVIF